MSGQVVWYNKRRRQAIAKFSGPEEGNTTCATEFSFNWLDGKSRTTNGRRSDAELECNT